MTRYIPDLPSYDLEELVSLFYEIGSYLEHPDPNAIPYTAGQYAFVKKLIIRKGGSLPEVA